jgi:hypothetical protein
MLIELLTPLILATTPASITLSEKAIYSHEVQSQVGEDGTTSYKTYTSNGTQTYDGNGRPSDADSDTDVA